MTTPAEELIERLVPDPRQVLVVIGSGMARASTKDAPCSSWEGLLADGITYCVNRELVPSAKWVSLRRQQLEEKEFIEVASALSKVLDAPESGNFKAWLQESVGSLHVSDPRLLHALKEWRALIATTDYDTLIEEETGLGSITWRDTDRLIQFGHGELSVVLHLHGIYSIANTVVLGASSYEDIVRDPLIQDLMRALVLQKTVVFVGCGAGGMTDPNIGGLLRWYRNVVGKAVCPSYLLAPEREREVWRPLIQGTQVRVVYYGADYSHLPGFLEQVAQRVREAHSPLEALQQRQLAFDHEIQAVLAEQDTLGPAETLRRTMSIVRAHWQAGGKRTAWSSVSGLLRRYQGSLEAEERVRFGLELAEMMQVDGVPDSASRLLGSLQADVERGTLPPDLIERYWRLRSACLAVLGPYRETQEALRQAFMTARDTATRERLLAERSELEYLQGEDAAEVGRERDGK